MASIGWRDEFETGIDAVDAEHAHLIDAINALVYRLGDKPSKALIAEVLGKIRGEIAVHFEAEERVMRKRGYDWYATHKAEHEILLDEIQAIMSAADETGSFAHGDLLVRRLTCWFAEHFKIHDERLHQKLG